MPNWLMEDVLAPKICYNWAAESDNRRPLPQGGSVNKAGRNFFLPLCLPKSHFSYLVSILILWLMSYYVIGGL